MSNLSVGAEELFLFIDNKSNKLHQMRLRVAKALCLKKKRGTYKVDIGRRAFMSLTAQAAKEWKRSYGAKGKTWNTLFPIADRKAVAVYLERWFSKEYQAGAFESLLPKKYQKAATKKQACVARASSLSDNGKRILRAASPHTSFNQSTLLKSRKDKIGFAHIVSGLNELVKFDLVIETTRQGARAWKLNDCGRAVKRKIGKG